MLSTSYNRLVWGIMILVLAVLAVRTRDHFAAYFEKVGALEVRTVPDKDLIYLRWRGKIAAPMASRISEALAAHEGEGSKIILSLSSPGGSVDEGAKVIRLLRSIREKHVVVTSVDEGAMCASMCVPVYLQGQQRIAAADADFMFHKVVFRDFFSNERDPSVPAASIDAETDRFFETYFVAAGVSQTWTRKLRSEIAGGNEVWKTGRELVDEKSGIVQEVM